MHDSPFILARVAPNNINDLEGFVLGFFQHLPSTSILCISLIGGDCANFLSEMSLLPCAHVPAWIFLSRLTKNQQPVSFLLPVDVICQGDSHTLHDSTPAHLRLYFSYCNLYMLRGFQISLFLNQELARLMPIPWCQ